MGSSNETVQNCSQAPQSADEIREKIQRLENLPPFPAIATQILLQSQKPDVEVPRVVQLIECEPAISAKVLMMANSPLYGATRPISTIGHAIVLLGFRTVTQMAIAIATEDVFSHGSPELAGQRNRIFRQSLASATIARAICSLVQGVNPDEAFLCGVMQDIGKLVFFEVVPSKYCEILEQFPSGDTAKVENELFGIDHAAVGKICGAKWGLPSPINAAIQEHHRLIGETEHELSQAIIAANYFGRQWQIGFDPNEMVETCDDIEQICGSEDAASLREVCAEQFAAVSEICSI